MKVTAPPFRITVGSKSVTRVSNIQCIVGKITPCKKGWNPLNMKCHSSGVPVIWGGGGAGRSRGISQRLSRSHSRIKEAIWRPVYRGRCYCGLASVVVSIRVCLVIAILHRSRTLVARIRTIKERESVVARIVTAQHLDLIVVVYAEGPFRRFEQGSKEVAIISGRGRCRSHCSSRVDTSRELCSLCAIINIFYGMFICRRSWYATEDIIVIMRV